MLFIIIFTLTLLLTIYIFKSLSNENLTLKIGLSPKSKNLFLMFPYFSICSPLPTEGVKPTSKGIGKSTTAGVVVCLSTETKEHKKWIVTETLF